MTQVFSVWFPYGQAHYKALVTLQVRRPDDARFQVRVLDQSLHALLPQGRLRFSVVHGLQHPRQLSSLPACELVLAVTDAITRHLSAGNTLKVPG